MRTLRELGCFPWTQLRWHACLCASTAAFQTKIASSLICTKTKIPSLMERWREGIGIKQRISSAWVMTGALTKSRSQVFAVVAELVSLQASNIHLCQKFLMEGKISNKFYSHVNHSWLWIYLDHLTWLSTLMSQNQVLAKTERLWDTIHTNSLKVL